MSRIEEGDRGRAAGPAGVVRTVAGALVVGLTVLLIGPSFAGDKDAGKDKKNSEVKSEKTAGETKAAKTADAKPVLKKLYVIQIKDHKFVPAKLVVPAKKKIKLRIENLDRTPEEFESHDLKREKVVAGGRKITLFVGPLKPGTYKFFGEFNPKTAQGVIVAR